MLLGIVLAVVGVLLLALAVWLRLGRTDGARSWVGEEQFERTVLVTLPLVGILCVCLAVLSASGPGPGATWVGGPLAVAFIVFFLWGPLQLPLPAWTLPKWYRIRTAARDQARRGRKNRRRRARAPREPRS